MSNLIFINYLLNQAENFYQKDHLIKEENLKQAFFYVNKALSVETFPSEGLLSKAYFLRGRINLSLQNFIESILDFDKTLEIEEDHYLAFYYRAKAKKELSFFNDALKDFDNAIKLNSKNKDFFIARAFLKIKIKLFSEALDDFDNAINIDQNSTFLFFQKGIYEIELGNFGEAVKNFDIALKKSLENNFDRELIEIHRNFAEEKYIENIQNLLNRNKLFKENKKY